MEEEINENGIDKEIEEMERALEKIDDSVYYEIVKLIIRKDKIWKARSINKLKEVVLEIILEVCLKVCFFEIENQWMNINSWSCSSLN